MSKHRTLSLQPWERIAAVVPERISGPGWSNMPVRVYIARNDGTVRTEFLQPDEQTEQLHTLFEAGEAMCAALRLAVPTRMIKK